MKASELADRICDFLKEADSPEGAIFALAHVQYALWGSTHAVACKNFEAVACDECEGKKS